MVTQIYLTYVVEEIVVLLQVMLRVTSVYNQTQYSLFYLILRRVYYQLTSD